jgi:NAD(P)-dependent dehydrogenase (short-subunit alcohol dehydrogenase family)
MKYMITGGNTGLGLVLRQYFGADGYSRGNGYDIVDQRDIIADLSLNYDVFINNAYDGEFGTSRTAYGQVQLLTEVAMVWQANQKLGHIINIGGVGSEDTGAPFTGWESYNANKAALKHHSLQWSQAFRTGQVSFRTTLITVDRLDTPAGRARPSWTGNGVSTNDVAKQIELCINANANTCVSEIVSWVNLDHKQ